MTVGAAAGFDERAQLLGCDLALAEVGKQERQINGGSLSDGPVPCV